MSLDHCTLTSERSIVRFGPWSGWPPGPDRPWLITSRNCAFLAMYDRKNQRDGLAASRRRCPGARDGFVAGQRRRRRCRFLHRGRRRSARTDRGHETFSFNGFISGDTSHINGRITGPRGAGSPPSVRFWEKLRPGRIEPVDLLLNPDYHPDRDRLKSAPIWDDWASVPGSIASADRPTERLVDFRGGSRSIRLQSTPKLGWHEEGAIATSTSSQTGFPVAIFECIH